MIASMGQKLCRSVPSLILAVMLATGCTARDPYVTMCGVALDLETGRQLVTDAQAKREAGDRAQAVALVDRARKSIEFAEGPLQGIGSKEIRDEATWISLDSAARHLVASADGVVDDVDASIVTQELDATRQGLMEATKVIPKECIQP